MSNFFRQTVLARAIALTLMTVSLLAPYSAQATQVSGQSNERVIIPVAPANPPTAAPSTAPPSDTAASVPAQTQAPSQATAASTIAPVVEAQPAAVPGEEMPEVDSIFEEETDTAQATPLLDGTQLESPIPTPMTPINTFVPSATPPEQSFPTFVDPNAPQVESTYAILIDADTGSVLFEKSSQERAYPASTTKIMTCILVLENINDLSTEVTIGEEAVGWSAANSLMGLVKGEVITVRSLLYGLMLRSGNDAALGLARFVGGSEDAFAAMMNAKAAELGMTNSHFVNPHGLTNENHYTTAADMAKLARYAMQNEDFRAIVATPQIEVPTTNMQPARTFYTTNRFLNPKPDNAEFNWSACTGIKTGSTSAAQGCLVTSATYNNMNLIAVAFHDQSHLHMSRWSDCRKMIEYGFNNLDQIDLGSIPFEPVLTTIDNASVSDELKGLLTLNIDASGMKISGLAAQLNFIRQNISGATIQPDINNGLPLHAPIRKGDVVGTASVRMGDSTLAVVNLVASRDVISNENDPQNFVTSLFGSGQNPEAKSNIPLYIFIGLGVLVVALLVVLFLRRGGLRKQVNRSARRSRRYYNYFDRS